jgi:Type VI secretion system effector, Hcp
MKTILQLGSPPVVEGSQRNLSFPGGIPVQSFTFGKQRPAPGLRSGQSNPGPTQESRVLVGMEDVDAAGLFRLVSNGKMIPEVKLSFLGNGADGYQFVMSNAVLSSAVPQGSLIEISINFTSVERRFLTMR